MIGCLMMTWVFLSLFTLSTWHYFYGDEADKNAPGMITWFCGMGVWASTTIVSGIWLIRYGNNL